MILSQAFPIKHNRYNNTTRTSNTQTMEQSRHPPLVFVSTDPQKSTFVSTATPENGLPREDGLYCLNASTSDILWTGCPGASIAAPPTVSQKTQTVYVATVSGDIIALDWYTGDIKWHITQDELLSPSPSFENCGVLYRDHLYIGTTTCNLYKIDPKSGNIVSTKKFGTRGGIRSRPPHIGDCLYISQQHSVTSLNITNNKKLWTFNGARNSLTLDARAELNSVYCTNSDVLVSIDAGTGNVRWKKSFQGKVLIVQQQSTDELVVNVKRDTTYTVHPGTGDISLEADTNGNVIAVAIDPKEPLLYTGTSNGYVECHSTATHTKLWSADIGSHQVYGLDVSENAVYVGSKKEKLTALGKESGNKVWPLTVDGTWEKELSGYQQITTANNPGEDSETIT
jgi:outer membrane protein assembly factor BamB